jgi:hypothetical protein
MARGTKHTPEQIVSLLRQIEAAVANGKTTPSGCREGGIMSKPTVVGSSPGAPSRANGSAYPSCFAVYCICSRAVASGRMLPGQAPCEAHGPLL